MDNVIKVVICDDHSLFREGIKAALRNTEDIVVIGEAENGMKLLQELKHVTPDVILLDINMPVMDGFATLPQLKRLYPEIKVIVLSWNNDMTWVTSMMNLGANSYLTKDDDSENIIEAIKTCHKREFYLNELTEKGIKKNLEKTPQLETPVTKFEKESQESEKKNPMDVNKKIDSTWKSLMKGIMWACIALLIVGGLFYLWSIFKGNMEIINNFLPNQNN